MARQVIRKDQSSSYKQINISKELNEYLNQNKAPEDGTYEDTLRRLLKLPSRIFITSQEKYLEHKNKHIKTKIRQYKQQAVFIMLGKQLEEE